MIQPTLIVLAAGMGSRYGGLKQLDQFGPSGETILEYSIFDAIRAGFKKVVFVVRKDIVDDFREQLGSKFDGKIEVEYVFQDIGQLPAGFIVPENRTKPWGTAHAVMAAQNNVVTPFAVINADDFYGAEAYQTIGDYLRSIEADSNKYSMVGYHVKRTLSPHGTVSRGICETKENGDLITVVERTKIGSENGEIYFLEDDGKHSLTGNELVSMNIMGFTPSYFKYCNEYFIEFLKNNKTNPKAEFYMPFVVNELINEGIAEMKVLESDANWFGVTYQEDKPQVIENIQKLVDEGKYPSNLWA